MPFSRALADGQYTLDAQLASTATPTPDTTASFTMGDARLRLTPTQNPVERSIGGQVDYVGRLAMAGQPLTGRPVALRFLRGVEVVPGDRADAAILQGRRRVLARTVPTDGDGRFVVTVDDPAGRPRASEIGGRLVAATADQPRSGNFVDGNARAQDVSGTRFGDGRRGRVRVVLGGSSNGPRDDVLRVTAPTSVAGETVRIYRRRPAAARWWPPGGWAARATCPGSWWTTATAADSRRTWCSWCRAGGWSGRRRDRTGALT